MIRRSGTASTTALLMFFCLSLVRVPAASLDPVVTEGIVNGVCG